ncbi:hypothetical protein D3C73_1454660 [compost metagenome]
MISVRGMVRCGSTDSSVIVVTASKPRKDWHTRAVPAITLCRAPEWFGKSGADEGGADSAG